MGDTTQARRSSGRPSKRKAYDVECPNNGKKFRSCEKSGCFTNQPTCCLLSCDSCSVSGYTSRWYHMSLGEHFCNNCFDNFYRPGKTGNVQFSKWSNEWAHVARASKPTIKRFVTNELLPYWVKCTQRQCGKWRIVRKKEVIDFKFIKNFKCPVQPNVKNACSVAEDDDVSLVLDPIFMSLIDQEPLLENSPAAPYLQRFLPEDVGICPINDEKTFSEIENVKLFLMHQSGESTIWIQPDELTDEEVVFAKQVFISHATYLGLRNFLVALWNLNPSKWLTFEKINENLICRGLIRIYLMSVAEQILNLLTKKSVINFGIIQNPTLDKIEKSKELQVLVIGAGVAGLAAASHLHNLGVNVVIFEAQSKLGGRVKDIPCLSSGAFIVEGLTNNPFNILAIQAEAEYQTLKDNTILFHSNGELVQDNVVKKSKFEFNGLLQGAIEWSMVSKVDDSFYSRIKNGCNEMKQMLPFCKDPDVFNNILSQSEIEMKGDMKNLSVLSWEFPIALQGDSGFICNGLRLLLIKLSRCVSIKYKQEVKSIDYTENKVTVVTLTGTHTFSKVLITVSPPILQNNSIELIPPLPEYKMKAIKNVGSFFCEKLILEFPQQFWTKAVTEPFSKFSVVSPEQIFELFIDVTSNKVDSTPTLVAFVSQKSFDIIDKLSDKEVVKKCVLLLKGVFHCDVEPTKWFLTHWRKEKYTGSYGSYLKVGSSPDTYDDMAKSIDNKLYFAGDATFRNVPSTVTGAYLSGLREAAKIVKDLELE